MAFDALACDKAAIIELELLYWFRLVDLGVSGDLSNRALLSRPGVCEKLHELFIVRHHLEVQGRVVQILSLWRSFVVCLINKF